MLLKELRSFRIHGINKYESDKKLVLCPNKELGKGGI
jgi:hypothetical protein